LVLLPIVYFIQTEALEVESGLNLNNSYPMQPDVLVLELESTYAIGEAPELTAIDLI
jgi:hypothetical protein